MCHASESEALRSDPHKSKRFCCCHSKTIHGMLSFNTAVRLRCMTWQFAYTPYIVEGYEVTDHSAGLTFQLTDLRKVLISRFVHVSNNSICFSFIIVYLLSEVIVQFFYRFIFR